MARPPRTLRLLTAALSGLAVFFGAASGSAQDPLRAFPNNYWVEFQTPWIRVIHARYPPHAEVGVHQHPETPTLFVYLSDSGPVRFEHAAGDTDNTTRPPLKAGQMRLSPGVLETHRVHNLGNQQSDFLRVELPTLPLGLTNFDVRIPAPDATFWQPPHPERVVYDGPNLRVTRLGITPHTELTQASTPGAKTAWLAVEAEGAQVNGQPAHPGQAWATPDLHVTAADTPVELVRLDLK